MPTLISCMQQILRSCGSARTVGVEATAYRSQNIMQDSASQQNPDDARALSIINLPLQSSAFETSRSGTKPQEHMHNVLTAAATHARYALTPTVTPRSAVIGLNRRGQHCHVHCLATSPQRCNIPQPLPPQELRIRTDYYYAFLRKSYWYLLLHRFCTVDPTPKVPAYRIT